jgi:hypothetical protein
MNRPYLPLLFFAVMLASSCQKQNVQPITAIQSSPLSIVAKWDLVKDSTSSQLFGPPVTHVYVGTPDDYYDFRSDGECYIRENGAYDTLTYKIVGDTSVVFKDISSYPSTINLLTNHSVRFNFALPQGPGGNSSRTVFLSK